MNLVFMGTPEFSIPSLTALADSESHRVELVITQPDKPKGRGRTMQPPPVKVEAEKRGIPVLQPPTLKSNTQILQTIENTGADAVIVIAYGKMIPDKMLEIPKYGFINVHASLLPAYRGAAPINRSILNGDKTTGISIMKIDQGMDSGPVYLEHVLPIGENENAEELTRKLAQDGAEKLLEALELIKKNALAPVEQDHDRATFAPMLKKEEGLIDWNNNPTTIHNQIRGLVPWPCAFTFMDGKNLRIHKAKALEKKHELEPGTMISTGSGISIACNGGFIIPEIMQLEGKKAMDSKAFACGLHSERTILGKRT